MVEYPIILAHRSLLIFLVKKGTHFGGIPPFPNKK